MLAKDPQKGGALPHRNCKQPWFDLEPQPRCIFKKDLAGQEMEPPIGESMLYPLNVLGNPSGARTPRQTPRSRRGLKQPVFGNSSISLLKLEFFSETRLYGQTPGRETRQKIAFKRGPLELLDMSNPSQNSWVLLEVRGAFVCFFL